MLFSQPNPMNLYVHITSKYFVVEMKEKSKKAKAIPGRIHSTTTTTMSRTTENE